MSHICNYIFYMFPFKSYSVWYSWPHAVFKGRMRFIRWTNENNAAIITGWLHSILVSLFPSLMLYTAAVLKIKDIIFHDN